MIDAGLDIPHGTSVLPSEERLNGRHIDDSLSSSVEASIEAIEGTQMSEEEIQESATSEEITLAPGLAKAFESSDDGAGERGKKKRGARSTHDTKDMATKD